MNKKNFKNHPALQFISPLPETLEPSPAEAAPPPPRRSPLYAETRSRRVQLLMRPGLHDRLKLQAARRSRSLNDLIHSVLADWLDSSE